VAGTSPYNTTSINIADEFGGSQLSAAVAQWIGELSTDSGEARRRRRLHASIDGLTQL
jgi:hypothetical protein